MAWIDYYKNGELLGGHEVISGSYQMERDVLAMILGYGDHDKEILDFGRVIIRKQRRGILRVRSIPGRSRTKVIFYK